MGFSDISTGCFVIIIDILLYTASSLKAYPQQQNALVSASHPAQVSRCEAQTGRRSRGSAWLYAVRLFQGLEPDAWWANGSSDRLKVAVGLKVRSLLGPLEALLRTLEL